jgi:SMODS-associated and fused to various effectors sensor domain
MMLAPSRAASGARLLGDDVQHLIVWYHAVRTQRADTTVVSLRVEAAEAGNVDDLTMTYSDRPPEYWQVKASVDATSPLTEDWLFAHEKGKLSMLQRLHNSWVKLGGPTGEQPRIVLATTKAIDPSDDVLARRATSDSRIVEVVRNADGRLGEARVRWSAHLGVTEPELIEFLDCLDIRHGQSEREWREKVSDVSHGARVRCDNDGIAVGVQQVRDWVKTPRQTFTPASIGTVIDELRLRVATKRALLVVQALERNPRAEAAHYAIDWVPLFAGDDPRLRRALSDPADASQILDDLAAARDRLRAGGLRHVEVDGPMRLPLWFTIGAQLGGTAGFSVAAAVINRASDRMELWSSSVTPARDAGLSVLPTVTDLEGAEGRPWVVSVNVSMDITEDVETYCASALPKAVHLRAFVLSPGPTTIRDAAHAVGLTFELRDRLRVMARVLRPPSIHLFLAMPGAVALILGNAWDRLPITTTYWDMGRPGAYEPATTIVS